MTRAAPLLLALALAAGAAADITEERLEEVPIERLLRNVDRQGPYASLQLGRLHAMAYVADVAQVRSGTLEPWFGEDPGTLPWARALDAGRPAARHHLDEAIRLHREALGRWPESREAALGLGWLLGMAGQRAEAVKVLRQAADERWAEEAPLELGYSGSAAVEAAGYLLQLLHPQEDAAEVAALTSRLATLAARPRDPSLPEPLDPSLISPVAVPLDDACDLAAARAPDARVAFDVDGLRRRGRWSWLTPRAAWLVLLPRDGQLRSGRQLLGACTWWVLWRDGYQPMAALDDDGDGALRGPELAGLGLWRDADLDGRSDPGELQTLAAWGVVALDVRALPGDGATIAAWAPRGVTLADGRTRPTWDLLLRLHPE